MRRGLRWTILLALVAGILAVPALAQEQPELKLTMSRDFGYGGFGQIQGLFSMKVAGPDDLQRVVFLIDGQAIGEDAEAPFKIQFHTDSYPAGMRRLNAIGFMADGRELSSNVIEVEFLSKEAASRATRGIIVPILGLLVLIFGVTIAATLFAARRRGRIPLGQPRNYGAFGGTICPKCGRPFALSLLGLNVGLGKLTPCPHCGKWSVVRRLPLESLRAAEAAELRGSQAGMRTAESAQDSLRKAIDDSRYQDL